MTIKDQAFGIIPVHKEGGHILFLLIQHNQGHWSFPKGHAEEGETALETAKREFEEETGIRDYKVIESPKFQEHYKYEDEKGSFDKTVTYFLGFVDNKDVTVQQKEIKDFRWITWDYTSPRCLDRKCG